jgi:hypothetical protein
MRKITIVEDNPDNLLLFRAEIRRDGAGTSNFTHALPAPGVSTHGGEHRRPGVDLSYHHAGLVRRPVLWQIPLSLC